MSPRAAGAQRLATAGLLAGILALAFLARLPLLVNADVRFDSDEAVNALVMKHLVERGEIALHTWDATYFGIVEGVLALPFTWVFGFEPVAFRLAAVVCALLQIVACWLLARRLYGAGAGLLAALLCATVSPMVVHWSAVAASGYLLVVAWGTFSLLGYEAVRRAGWPPTRWRLFASGAVVGFGLYIYELYLVYAALFTAAVAVPSVIELFREWQQPPRSRRFGAALVQLADRGAAIALGVAAGWAPTLAVHLTGRAGGKTPEYGLASAGRSLDNLDLLLSECLPALLRLPATDPGLRQWIGAPDALGWVGGLAVATCYVLAVASGLRSPHRAHPADGPRLPATHHLLLGLLPVVAAAFALSPNPTDAMSARYLLPLLSSLPVLTAGWLARLATRRRTLAAVAVIVLTAHPVTALVDWYRGLGMVDRHLRVVRLPDSLAALLDQLEAAGIRGGYAEYWNAYRATFASGERVVFTAVDWDRQPRYTAFVDRLPAEAYLFHVRTPRSEQGRNLDERLARSRPAEILRRGPFRAHIARDRRRLLAPLRPLTAPEAEVIAESVPSLLTAGSETALTVRVVNRGVEMWPAVGDTGGQYRVALSYHWLDDAGRRLGAYPLERGLLPRDLAPGEGAETVVRVQAPPVPGDYRLLLTAVQDGVTWFDEANGGGFVVPVRVVPDRT